MKRSIAMFLILFSCAVTARGAASEKVIFGPAKYDVKERYGKENIYKESFNAAAGTAIIRIQNGTRIPERSELIELSLNGEKIIPDGRYDYNYIACVVQLRKENTFQLTLKDVKPSGLKRPALPPRFVIITVLPENIKLPQGTFAVNTWEGLKNIADLLQKIRDPETVSPAASSIDLKNDVAQRAEAMRKLSDRKDRAAQPLIAAVYNDVQVSSDVRGEAALALGVLGDKTSIPALINGMLDPDEKVRLGSTRALSFYREEDTRELLAKMLERLDSMRRDAVISAIESSGWKPVGTLLTLAGSKDPEVSRTAIRLLGSTGDPRASELLLNALQQPGNRDVRAIIAALGGTRDSRAVEPLAAIAKDPAKRAGKEAELGEALASLGDPKSAGLIAEMIRKTNSLQVRVQLQQSYRKLTGKEYK